ncbi:hypothetical protein PACTADRAFT_51416 [Pachysolen tannophilus NRRL Y-2460]|uniref:threonine synthase n=1 Tax=Pachysolen tannophilus NRRL Y-2460 TaxID=669874 RepID=A0A1E4TPF7_PACTA|nr:hypothetical protein PACTADRAFT_51416 [Pachysolen tannophilus NRRL Y-2460]
MSSSFSASQSYRSTRSEVDQAVSFEEAVITGLAKDGGLFIPSVIPKLPSDFLTSWNQFSFQELAFNIMRLYISVKEISDEDLKKLIKDSYSTFRTNEITPLVKLNSVKNLYLLELFHGPTYAFKDVALQFVGNLFEFFLNRKNENISNESEKNSITVVGATSGDTGSAAIYGLRNKANVSVFILYPTGRISQIQELQMTTVNDANIHTLSVNGTFDDCQNVVKKVFNDTEFNDKYHIGAVNSINWARILAQITYYFHSYFQLKNQLPEDERNNFKIKFIVPSGNFGDILAGFYAKEMGLPIEQLIIATNENDILDRFLKTGNYDKSSEVNATYSPAMDILISSNFERLLWYMVKQTDGENNDNKTGAILAQFMLNLLSPKGVFSVSKETLAKTREIFDSFKITNDETVSTIKKIYQENNYIMDPHTSVGVTAALKKISQDDEKTQGNFKYISMSTAHPAKFSQVVNKSLTGLEGYDFENKVLPEAFKKFDSLPKKVRLVESADLKLIETVIVQELENEKLAKNSN